MASENQDFEPSIQAAPAQGVGSLLRETRQRLGHELEAVAVQLRIRQPYLKAIEEGHYQDLPGSAYAVGFVRGYAEYLGLDSAEIVRRFKQETGGDFSGRRELVFPSASSEGSFPTGGVLFLALIAGLLVYGVWYWVSREPSVAESVPSLPDRLAALVHKPSDAPEAPKPGDAAPAGVVSVPPAQPSLAPGMSREDVVPPNEGEAPPADKPAPQVAMAPAPAPTPAPAPAPAQTVPTYTPAPLPSPAAPPVVAEAAPPADGAPPTVVEPPLPTSKIVLKSLEDCWVKIRDGKGKLVYNRLLKKGERYVVPQRPGQTLTAGNAGALVVLVDNKPINKLGELGQSRHDIPLEPEALKTLETMPPPPPAPPEPPAPVSPPAAETPAPAPASVPPQATPPQ